MTYNKAKNVLYLISVFFGICCLYSCSYSFTGASIPSHLKTIAIPLFKDNSGSGEPELREDFTNSLTKKFLEDNQLRVVPKVNADALLECTIISLSDSPVAVVSGEEVASRKITITVRVLYRDLVKKQTIFERNISNYGDYSTTGDITTAREKAINTSIENITEDILINVVSNW